MLRLLQSRVTWRSSFRCLTMEGLLSLTTVQKWVFSCRYMCAFEVNYVTLRDELFVIVSPLENPSSGTRISRASTRSTGSLRGRDQPGSTCNFSDVLDSTGLYLSSSMKLTVRETSALNFSMNFRVLHLNSKNQGTHGCWLAVLDVHKLL